MYVNTHVSGSNSTLPLLGCDATDATLSTAPASVDASLPSTSAHEIDLGVLGLAVVVSSLGVSADGLYGSGLGHGTVTYTVDEAFALPSVTPYAYCATPQKPLAGVNVNLQSGEGVNVTEPCTGSAASAMPVMASVAAPLVVTSLLRIDAHEMSLGVLKGVS